MLDLEHNKDASDRNHVDAAAASAPGLSTSLFIFSLLINECLPKSGRQFPLQYCQQKAVFFYHLLAPAYTCNIDG